MKKLAAVVLAALLAVSLAGCNWVDTEEEIIEFAKMKKVCEDNGGVFITWRNEAGESWKCDLSTVKEEK